MKTKEEVIERFKNAKTVRCAYDNGIYAIENLEINCDSDYDWYLIFDNRDKCLLSYGDNFAKIIEYKETKVIRRMKRKEIPLYSGLLTYLPEALNHVANCSYVCNEQHNPNEPLHWAKEKSKEHPDSMMRHLADHKKNPIDDDGVLHLAKVAWRALANLEIYLEEQKKEPFDKKLF